ncbi:hypothetical protein K8I85_10960 [bacterium]|nr:hypothetical protein [bacterium]
MGPDGRLIKDRSRGWRRSTKELLLGLGGCTGFDVALILNKRGIAFDKLEVELVT